MRLFVIPVLSAGLLFGGTAFGHGESKPGPHGGEIRMPSAFHVEAVSGDEALTVYILDMQFKNPTTENASVSVEVRQDGATTKLPCGADVDSFRCPLPEGVSLDEGELVISASRDDLATEKAVYELPLMQE